MARYNTYIDLGLRELVGCIAIARAVISYLKFTVFPCGSFYGLTLDLEIESIETFLSQLPALVSVSAQFSITIAKEKKARGRSTS